MAAEEYILSGDVPVKDVSRLKWGSTVEQYKTENGPNINESCELRSLCIELSPGDLKTFILKFNKVQIC